MKISSVIFLDFALSFRLIDIPCFSVFLDICHDLENHGDMRISPKEAGIMGKHVRVRKHLIANNDEDEEQVESGNRKEALVFLQRCVLGLTRTPQILSCSVLRG